MSVEDQARLEEFLCTEGLAKPDEEIRWVPLTGGVSSEIWRVDLPGRSICVKRALPKLKVVADWWAPISRNIYEWRWLCFAAKLLPSSVPEPLAHDVDGGVFAMQFLDPTQYPVWKSQLLRGVVDPAVASRIGQVLAAIHQASANRCDVARDFDSLDNFRALRIDPYLLAAVPRHPDLAGQLRELAERTAAMRRGLVHGDVSPKNILVGPTGPVFLDAECAWYGDPAFDLAFCLNHLLLKMLVLPDCVMGLFQSFSQLAESYFELVFFEPRSLIEARAAQLLPALMLARVDGLSPVEYLVGRTSDQDLVRRIARSFIASPAARLATIAEAWSREIDRGCQDRPAKQKFDDGEAARESSNE